MTKILLNEGNSEFIERKSVFIGFAAPVKNEEDANSVISRIKKNNNNATHNCFAYVTGENFDTQRISDDGEPTGTAGMPILNVLKNENISNAVVVVTRYFGGILLGTGGLCRAYSKAARDAVHAANPSEKKSYLMYIVSVEYSLSGRLKNEFKKSGITVQKIEYTSLTEFTVLVPSENVNFPYQIDDITSAAALVELKKSVFCAEINGQLVIV
jgi:uncharacterized YigZ family protein